MFIGRINELDFLNKKYNGHKAELIFFYGRRRHGKTTILNQFAQNKNSFFYTATEISSNDQLQKFNTGYSNAFNFSKNYIGKFSDWDEILKSLSEIKMDNNEKILIIIDEFQYMIKEERSIASILQKYWDHYYSKMNIMIVLCGSSMSFIEKEILAYKNPLYGRATGIYKLKEMDFYESIQFFPNFSTIEKVYAYSILGGSPYNLRLFDDNISVKENVITNIIENGSRLRDEVFILLHAELNNISTYSTIIKAIANGATTLNEITQLALIDKTSTTSVYLNNLMELGYVDKEYSINSSKKEQINRSKGYYKLSDNYFKFYYLFIDPNINSYNSYNLSTFYDKFIQPDIDKYASSIFEKICTEFIIKKNYNNDLPEQFDRFGKYIGKHLSNKEEEIDIVALNDESILIGECKFKNTPFSYNEYKKTINKLNILNQYKNVYYCLFSKSGFDNILINLEKEDSYLLLFDLEKIVNYNFNS